MSTDHSVKQGECISSIAFDHGFNPQTLWDDAHNQGLRTLRENANTLVAGVDFVHVRDLEVKNIDCATGLRHRFVRHGVPEYLQLRFLDEKGQPRANLPYTLQIDDGPEQQGSLDSNGVVRKGISPSAARAVLVLQPTAKRKERFDLILGALPPAELDDGTEQRLRSLGYLNDLDALGDEAFELALALRRFQRERQLEETGTADETTLKALKIAYGS